MLNENLAKRVSLDFLIYSQGLHLVSLREPTRETAPSGTCNDSLYSTSLFKDPRQKKSRSLIDHYSLKLDLDICHGVVE